MDDREAVCRHARLVFRAPEFDRPGVECVDRVKRVVETNSERPVLRGAFGRVVFGSLSGGDASDRDGVAVKLQHVYEHEASQGLRELRLLPTINRLRVAGIPNLIETFYVWSWRSKRDRSAQRATWSVGVVMEAAECDLLQQIEEDPLLPDERVVAVSFQILAAYATVRECVGVAHRDLKCNNAFLLRPTTRELRTRAWGRRRTLVLGEGWLGALADFGSALSLDQAIDSCAAAEAANGSTVRHQFGADAAGRRTPVHSYTYGGGGLVRLHDAATRTGVVPVWADMIQWFSSLLTLPSRSPDTPWRAWSMRALALARWFEECTYLAYIVSANGGRAQRGALARLLRTHPCPVPPSEGDLTGAPPMEHRLRWGVVPCDEVSVDAWRADVRRATGRGPGRSALKHALRRDLARFCNLIFERDFLAASRVPPNRVFAVDSSASLDVDYDMGASQIEQHAPSRIGVERAICDVSSMREGGLEVRGGAESVRSA